MSDNVEHKAFWDKLSEERFKKFLEEPPPPKPKLIDKAKKVIKQVTNKKNK